MVIGATMLLLETLTEQTNTKVSSTSTAFLAACHALKIKDASIASVYQKKITDLFINFLAQGNINTIHQQSKGWTKRPSESQQLTETQIIDLSLR